MTVLASRTALAKYMADQIQAGEQTSAVDMLAAYLVDARRTGEADLIVRSVLEILEQRGHVVVDVTSARPIDAELQKGIQQLVGGDTVELRARIDPTILGGLRVTTPSRSMDATLGRRIEALKTAKIT